MSFRTEGASGTGLATMTADGTVLDVWYPAPALGADAPDVMSDLEPLAGADGGRGRQHRGAAHDDRLAGRAARRHGRRLPAAAPALAPADRPARGRPDGRLRAARQRGVDQPRPVRGGGLRADQGAVEGPRTGHRVRGGQVPPHGRLRAARRRADRRRRPRAARRAPGHRHHGHARGLRQLQRRHARQRDGGGADLRGRRRRRRLGRRRWRVDHGHAVGRRQGDDQHRLRLPARAPTPGSASRSATTWWWRRGSTSPPAPG